MRINQLKVRGFRAFNEEQTIDLSDPIAVFEGPDGSGKTSLAEAIECCYIYGNTLKSIKGEELSKREYAGCYRNTHFIGPRLPFEANITDIPRSNHTIVRELKGDESLVPRVDGMPKSDLREFGIDTMYDRPLILQHTLQDFTFMKPRGRYEMLSAMLGLEPLMTFRNTVESGKNGIQRENSAQNSRRGL